MGRMYILFKLLIRDEEDHLRREFGPAYLEYEKQVNCQEVITWTQISTRSMPRFP